MLQPKVQATLDVKKEVLDTYVREVAEDPLRDEVLEPLEGLEGTLVPVKKWKLNKLLKGVFERSLRRKRNKSRPGPNQIPYKVIRSAKI